MANSARSKATSMLWKTIINSGNPFIELRKHTEEIDEDFYNLAISEAYRHPSFSDVLTPLLQEVSTILSELNHARQIVNAANSYSQANEYDKALKGYKHAIQIFEMWDCSTEISRCVMNIGVVYARKGDYDTALKCLDRAKKDFESKKLDVEAMQCEVNIASIHQERQEYKKAMETLTKARDSFHSRNLNHERAVCESNIASLLALLVNQGERDD